MSSNPREPLRWNRPSLASPDGDEALATAASRTYTLVCVAALGVMLLALWERGLWPWAMFPILVGSMALTFRWKLATPMLLVSMGILLFFASALRRYAFRLSDPLLSGAILTFVVAHYRLLGLTTTIFPRDLQAGATDQARLLARGASAPTEAGPVVQRREERLVGTGELLSLLLTVPLWVLLSQAIWWWLGRQSTGPNLIDEGYRFLLLICTLSLGLLGAAAIFAYLRQLGMHATEAQMYLQDTQWLETRKEQRLIGRWLAWARKRNRKENV